MPPRTYNLTIAAFGVDDETTGDLNVTASMNIVGANAGSTIINGNGSAIHDRVFNVAPGTTVNISGVAITNGGQTSLGAGGGILNAGNLTLSNCIISVNTAFDSGGIENVGFLTILKTAVRGNHAVNSGGGVGNGPDWVLRINRF